MYNEFQEKTAGFFKRLGNAKLMVLATSKDNRVTARMMTCVIIDGTIYFQTDKKFDKYNQIAANPMVALCADNVQIEGIASAHGRTMDPQNKFFAEAYERYHKNSFDSYSWLPDTVMIKVVPTKITLWAYEGKNAYREFFDLEKRTYQKEYYLTEKNQPE